MFSKEMAQYDQNIPFHERNLKKLWDTLFPGKPTPPGLKSEDWKTVGFQSNNPRTDFRGSGIIGLHCLNYFCSKYRNNKREMLEKEEEYFFFALYGINLCFALLRFFHFIEGNVPTMYQDFVCNDSQFKNFMIMFSKNKEAFYELHAHLFITLEVIWQDEKKKNPGAKIPSDTAIFNRVMDN